MMLRAGDVVAIAPESPGADSVTIDRAMCCCRDMTSLEGKSAANAATLYEAVEPHDTRLVRAGRTVANVVLRLLHSPCRLFIHGTAAVDAVIRCKGLVPR